MLNETLYYPRSAICGGFFALFIKEPVPKPLRRRETHSKIVIVEISELLEHIIDKNVFLIHLLLVEFMPHSCSYTTRRDLTTQSLNSSLHPMLKPTHQPRYRISKLPFM